MSWTDPRPDEGTDPIQDPDPADLDDDDSKTKDTPEHEQQDER